MPYFGTSLSSSRCAPHQASHAQPPQPPLELPPAYTHRELPRGSYARVTCPAHVHAMTRTKSKGCARLADWGVGSGRNENGAMWMDPHTRCATYRAVDCIPQPEVRNYRSPQPEVRNYRSPQPEVRNYRSPQPEVHVSSFAGTRIGIGGAGAII